MGEETSFSSIFPIVSRHFAVSFEEKNFSDICPYFSQPENRKIWHKFRIDANKEKVIYAK